MIVVPLDGATAGAWAALFEASGCSCYCRYWHFEGTKHEWLARSFEAPGDSRDEQLALVRAGGLEARGLVAMEGDAALGWMKLAPRARLPKLRRQGAYRPLDLGDDDGVWSIGCLLVRPDRRRSGVARALVEAAERHVREWGGATIEAYPRRVAEQDEPLHDEQAWTGTARLFASCGFAEVAGEGPYPVMRRLVARV